MRTRQLAFLVGVLLAASSCSSPTRPTVTDMSGRWVRDTNTDCFNSVGQLVYGCAMTMTIAQNGATLSGTFTWEGTHGGSLSGGVVDTTISITLTVDEPDPGCAFRLTGPFVGDRWSATGTFGCTGGQASIDPTRLPPMRFNRAR